MDYLFGGVVSLFAAFTKEPNRVQRKYRKVSDRTPGFPTAQRYGAGVNHQAEPKPQQRPHQRVPTVSTTSHNFFLTRKGITFEPIIIRSVGNQ